MKDSLYVLLFICSEYFGESYIKTDEERTFDVVDCECYEVVAGRVETNVGRGAEALVIAIDNLTAGIDKIEGVVGEFIVFISYRVSCAKYCPEFEFFSEITDLGEVIFLCFPIEVLP